MNIKKQNSTTTNLKDLANSLKSSNEKSEAISEEIFTKYLHSSSNNFGKEIKLQNSNVISSLDSLLVSKEDSLVTLPLNGTSFASFKFKSDDIKSMILDSKTLNPTVTNNTLRILNIDEKLIESESKAAEKLEEVLGSNLVTGKIIKDITISKKGDVYALLNNELLICKNLKLSIFSAMTEDDQSRIIKSIIPKELQELMVKTSVSLNSFEVGRVGYNLAVQLDILEIFKRIIIPNIIVKEGVTTPTLGHNNYAEEYSRFLLALIPIFKDGNFFFGIETKFNRSNLQLLLKKSQFICANISLKENAFRSYLINSVKDLYARYSLKDLYTAEELDDASNTEVLSDKIELMNSFEPTISYVPLASVASFKSQISDKMLSEVIKIDKYNTPTFIPIINFNFDEFKVDPTGAFTKSIVYLYNKGMFTNINYDKINDCFGRIVDKRNLTTVRSGLDNTIGIIPDLKRVILNSILKPTDTYSDYKVSVNSDENAIAFSVQIGVNL